MTDPQTPLGEKRPSAHSSERLEEARRRLFEPPPQPPFWASPEFRRMGALLLLLVLVGIGGLMVFWSRIDNEQSVAEQEAAQQREGTPVPPDPVLREQRLGTLFQGALSDTQNGQDFNETSGYTNLLREIAPYTQEEVAAKAKRWLDYDSAMKDPDGWRGEFVRERGLVAGLRAERLQTPVLGVKDVWRGFMCQGDMSEKVVFDLLTPPPEIRFNYDAWDVEGVFYRTVKFEDNEGRVHEAPYIIAKAIHPAQAESSRLGILKYPLVMLMAVVGLALFLARLLLLLAKSKRPAPPGAGEQIRRLMMLEQARKTSPPTPPPSS